MCLEFWGWHFHFAYPGYDPDDPSRPTESESGRLPMSHEADSQLVQFDRSEATGLVAVSDLIDLPGPALLALTQAFDPDVGHFFDGFAPTLPLPMRLGISRS